ncbi:MAG: hypothetical protein SAMD01599839_14460 [Rectinema sp.]|jgi:hypothetical protein
MQLKNGIGALEPELLRIQSSSDLEVLPETISGSPQSGILASGSSARTAPSHGNSRNGRKGFCTFACWDIPGYSGGTAADLHRIPQAPGAFSEYKT